VLSIETTAENHVHSCRHFTFLHVTYHPHSRNNLRKTPPIAPLIMSAIEQAKQLSLRTGQAPSNNALGINAPPSPAFKSTAAADSSVHYTCFIRLPFPRGDFVDPPQVSVCYFLIFKKQKILLCLFGTYEIVKRLTGTLRKIGHFGRSFPRLLIARSWIVCIRYLCF
jgi:hypothetical protein